MAKIIDLTRNPVATGRRVFHASGGQRTLARVDLSRPGAVEALNEVAADWLFEQCGDDGKRKLLREHDLLAA